MSLEDAVDAFLEHEAGRGLAPGTLVAKHSALSRFLIFCGSQACPSWADLRRADVEHFAEWLAGQGLSGSYLADQISHLRGFLRHLHTTGRTLSDLARMLPRLPVSEQPLPPPPLAEEAVAAVLEAMPRDSIIDLRNIAIVELLYGSGLRVGEAVALRQEDLDLARATVTIRHGKGDKLRTAALFRGARLALQDYLALRPQLLRGPDVGDLFLGAHGKRVGVQAIQRMVRRAGRRVGIARLHPHLLRHSIAVHLLRGGTDIRYIQEFLGHDQLDTTKIYLRLVPGHLKEDYEAAMPGLG